MADIPLAPIRIGYPYSVQLDFPAGFLQAGEGVRTRLRRFVGDLPIEVVDERDGDSIIWSIEDTSAIPAGQYLAEGEIYDTADPATAGTMLTDNRYTINAQHSVSEPAE